MSAVEQGREHQGDREVEYDADVVVVGSGAGGAVVACELAEAGQMQAVVCRRNGRFAAGLFGMAIGAVFFGEGLCSRVRDAGEVALAELVGRLRAGGFRFVDLHFLGGHTASVETLENVRGRYRAPEPALEAKAKFPTGEEEFWPRAINANRSGRPIRHARVA